MPEDPREAYYHNRVRECGPHYEGFEVLATEAALNLIYTHDVLLQVVARYLADYGLSKSTFNVLMILRNSSPEGMLLHNLGELLLVSRANITGLVDHLEQKGFVTRVVDNEDRRARFARITQKGLDLLDGLLPLHFRTVAQLLDGLSNPEKEQLIGLLKKARASVSRHAAVIENRIPA